MSQGRSCGDAIDDAVGPQHVHSVIVGSSTGQIRRFALAFQPALSNQGAPLEIPPFERLALATL